MPKGRHYTPAACPCPCSSALRMFQCSVHTAHLMACCSLPPVHCSDPLGYRSDSGGLQHQHMRPASFDSLGGGGQSYGDSFGASPHTVSAMPGQGQSPGLEHMAAMHAAQHMGTANMYRGACGFHCLRAALQTRCCRCLRASWLLYVHMQTADVAALLGFDLPATCLVLLIPPFDV